MRRYAMVLAVLTACGSESDPAAGLEGKWGLIDGPCVLWMEFRGSEYVAMQVCDLDNGSGAEVERGTYELGDDIVLHPTHSTCPDARDTQERLGYSVDGDTLTLTAREGIARFERFEPEDDAEPNGGASAAFGCYDDDGAFEPHELAEI
jgi:hypothetical protein